MCPSVEGVELLSVQGARQHGVRHGSRWTGTRAMSTVNAGGFYLPIRGNTWCKSNASFGARNRPGLDRQPCDRGVGVRGSRASGDSGCEAQLAP